MTTKTKTIDRVTVRWSNVGEPSEGWHWAVYYTDNTEDRGRYTYKFPDDACESMLQEAVRAVAFDHGLTIRADAAAVGLDNGGWAEWGRDA